MTEIRYSKTKHGGKSLWPLEPQTDEELRALCGYLVENHVGEWYWNSYSGISASVPKGHPHDDADDDEPGCAWVAHINQIPEHEGHGDELHHPLPRHIAAFVEKCDPAFVLSLLERIELLQNEE